MSRYELARRTGIDEANLSRFLHEGINLSLAKADLLAAELGLVLVKKPRRKKP